MRSGRQPDDAGDWPTRKNNQTPIGEGKNSGAYKQREAAEEAAEAESSSDVEATAKCKEQMALASSSDNERTANESTDNVMENKGAGQAKKKSKRRVKKVRRRAKPFKESTAELVEVLTLEMVMEFKPMPDQTVVLQVLEDVESWEFVAIMHYADDVGYRIQNKSEIVELIMQRIKEKWKELTEGEDEPGPWMPNFRGV